MSCKRQYNESRLTNITLFGNHSKNTIRICVELIGIPCTSILRKVLDICDINLFNSFSMNNDVNKQYNMLSQ